MSMDQIEGLEPIHENWGDVDLGEKAISLTRSLSQAKQAQQGQRGRQADRQTGSMSTRATSKKSEPSGALLSVLLNSGSVRASESPKFFACGWRVDCMLMGWLIFWFILRNLFHYTTLRHGSK